jgi:LuxR family transcriptional regulator, maltose regulon positive regulatory protein
VRTSCSLFLAEAKQAEGDFNTALEMLDRAERPRPNSTLRPGIKALSAAFHGVLALRRNELSEALAWSERIPDVNTLLFGKRHLAVRLMIARGEKKAALQKLQELYETAAKSSAKGLMIIIRVYQTLATDSTNEALAFLSDALRMGETEDYIRAFVDEGPLLTPLLRRALAQGITPDYTSKLLGIIEMEDLRRKVTKAKKAPALSMSSELLSERELEVLRLVANGLSNQQIADKLTISLNTAKTHVAHLFEKLSAKDRLQAVTRAKELKLI